MSIRPSRPESGDSGRAPLDEVRKARSPLGRVMGERTPGPAFPERTPSPEMMACAVPSAGEMRQSDGVHAKISCPEVSLIRPAAGPVSGSWNGAETDCVGDPRGVGRAMMASASRVSDSGSW